MQSATRLGVLSFCCLAMTLAAQENAAIDPVCGFKAKHFYLDAGGVRQGLNVDLLAGDVAAGRPTVLRFSITRQPGGVPVDDLQVEHEKFLHVIGVRDDLKEFFHIHPVKVGPGLWAVEQTFTNGGNYKLWCDVKYHGVAYSFGHPLLAVPGAIGEDRSKESAANYRLEFKPPTRVVVGETNRFEFAIRDRAGNPVATENFLGAAMHLVIVKSDLSVFLHAHPDNHAPVATRVVFSEVFPQPGDYRLFVQFRPKGTALPAGEALLEEFEVRVSGVARIAVRSESGAEARAVQTLRDYEDYRPTR